MSNCPILVNFFFMKVSCNQNKTSFSHDYGISIGELPTITIEQIITFVITTISVKGFYRISGKFT